MPSRRDTAHGIGEALTIRVGGRGDDADGPAAPSSSSEREASDARLSDHLGSCVFRNDWIRKKQSPDKRREKKEKKTACFMRLFVQDS